MKIQTSKPTAHLEDAGPLARLTVHYAARAQRMTNDAEDSFQFPFFGRVVVRNALFWSTGAEFVSRRTEASINVLLGNELSDREE
jgi:hypothetical protein